MKERKIQGYDSMRSTSAHDAALYLQNLGMDQEKLLCLMLLADKLHMMRYARTITEITYELNDHALISDFSPSVASSSNFDHLSSTDREALNVCANHYGNKTSDELIDYILGIGYIGRLSDTFFFAHSKDIHDPIGCISQEKIESSKDIKYCRDNHS